MVIYSEPSSIKMSSGDIDGIPNFTFSDDPQPSTDKNDAEDEEEPVGKLEEESKKRKERLKALRQKLMGGGDDDEGNTKQVDAPLPKWVGDKVKMSVITDSL